MGQNGFGQNRSAIEVTLAELERLGRLSAIDAAEVQALRSMADALDTTPGNAQLWREYRGGIEKLVRSVGDEAFDDIIAGLRAPVRDQETTRT